MKISDIPFSNNISYFTNPTPSLLLCKGGEGSNYIKRTLKNIASFLGIVSSLRWVFFGYVPIFSIVVGISLSTFFIFWFEIFSQTYICIYVVRTSPVYECSLNAMAFVSLL